MTSLSYQELSVLRAFEILSLGLKRQDKGMPGLPRVVVRCRWPVRSELGDAVKGERAAELLQALTEPVQGSHSFAVRSVLSLERMHISSVEHTTSSIPENYTSSISIEKAGM